MADRVDEALNQYMRSRGIEGPWETRERILVGVTGRGSDETLIRRAARMAARSGGELLVLHVIPEEGSVDGQELGRVRDLTGSLSGSFHEVAGDSIPTALLDFARAENVTQIVVGASTHSRWRHMTRGSIVSRVIRNSGAVDIHVISTRPRDRGGAIRSPRRGGVSQRRRTIGFLLAAAGLPLVTLVDVALRGRIGFSSLVLTYLMLVVGIAAIGGLWPAIVSSLAASLLINWFLTPPLHTWTIAEPEHLFAIVVFVVVAALVSVLVDRAARAQAEAQRAGRRPRLLLVLQGRCCPRATLSRSSSEHLRTTFGLTAVSVVREGGGHVAGRGCRRRGSSFIPRGRERIDRARCPHGAGPAWA